MCFSRNSQKIFQVSQNALKYLQNPLNNSLLFCPVVPLLADDVPRDRLTPDRLAPLLHTAAAPVYKTELSFLNDTTVAIFCAAKKK